MLRFTFLTFALAMSIPLAAHAGGYDGDVQASAQAGIYAAPQADVQSYVVPNAPAVQQQVIERQITIPAEYEDVVVRRQVAPERTVIQRDVIQRDVVHYTPVRALAYAPVRSFAVGNSCNVGAQALANVGYGVANNVGVGRGLRQRAVGGQRAQKVVTRSRAVTVTRRPGVLNGLLGR